MNYRTIWLSDIHLGTIGCQAEKLLDFLRDTQSDTVYLVGDIIDLWAMRRRIRWAPSHNTVVQKVLKRARSGTRVIYIPGNHDEAVRDYCGMSFGGIEIHRRFIHVTATGHRILCEHGDDFDIVVRYHKWLAKLGMVGYHLLHWVNSKINWVRRNLGWGHWSLSAFLKSKVKRAVSFIDEFERNVVDHARKQDVHGVLCGHIHHAKISEHDGIVYFNTGDVVESCTAIAETHAGEIQLLCFARNKIEVLQTYRFAD